MVKYITYIFLVVILTAVNGQRNRNGKQENLSLGCNGVTRGKGATWDPVTNTRINGLDPRIQESTREFINTVEHSLCVQLRVTAGLRTMEEQQALYNKGRFGNKEKKVTNAKPGQSYHNYGLAFDVVVIKDKKADWKRLDNGIVKIATDLGFEWGGHWKSFKDYPHFQKTFGLKLKRN